MITSTQATSTTSNALVQYFVHLWPFPTFAFVKGHPYIEYVNCGANLKPL